MAAGLTQLDAYREQADRFIAELDEEYYLHYAGHKETLDLEEIYARHSDLTTAEIAREIGRRWTATRACASCGASPARAISASSRATYDEKLAGLEAELEAEVDGERSPSGRCGRR